MPNAHRRLRRDSTVELSRDSTVEELKTEHVEIIHAVEWAAETETGSRLPMGERPIQLDSLQHVQFSILLPNPSAVVASKLGIQYTPPTPIRNRLNRQQHQLTKHERSIAACSVSVLYCLLTTCHS